MLTRGLLYAVFLLGLLQAPSPVQAGGAMAEFKDPSLGVSYRYPAEFRTSPEMAAAIQQGFAHALADPDRAKEAKCLTIPLVAAKRSGAPGSGEFGLILLMKIDYECAGEENGAEYLGQDAQRLMMVLERFGKSATEDAVRYKLGERPAAFVKGSAPAKMLGEGGMVHAASVCTLAGTSSLCWLILDSNHKAMPGLMAYPVSFEGKLSVPLVPKDLVEAW